MAAPVPVQPNENKSLNLWYNRFVRLCHRAILDSKTDGFDNKLLVM
jgi:hypothetical protein